MENIPAAGQRLFFCDQNALRYNMSISDIPLPVITFVLKLRQTISILRIFRKIIQFVRVCFQVIQFILRTWGFRTSLSAAPTMSVPLRRDEAPVE